MLLKQRIFPFGIHSHNISLYANARENPNAFPSRSCERFCTEVGQDSLKISHINLVFAFVQSYILKISKNLTTFGGLLDQNLYSDSKHVLSAPIDFYHTQNVFKVFTHDISCVRAHQTRFGCI